MIWPVLGQLKAIAGSTVPAPQIYRALFFFFILLLLFFLFKGLSSVLRYSHSHPWITRLCLIEYIYAFLLCAFPLDLVYCVRASPMVRISYSTGQRVKLVSMLLILITLLEQLWFALSVTMKYWTGSWRYQAQSWMSNYYHLSDDPYSDWNQFTPKVICISHRCG